MCVWYTCLFVYFNQRTPSMARSKWIACVSSGELHFAEEGLWPQGCRIPWAEDRECSPFLQGERSFSKTLLCSWSLGHWSAVYRELCFCLNKEHDFHWRRALLMASLLVFCGMLPSTKIFFRIFCGFSASFYTYVLDFSTATWTLQLVCNILIFNRINLDFFRDMPSSWCLWPQMYPASSQWLWPLLIPSWECLRPSREMKTARNWTLESVHTALRSSSLMCWRLWRRWLYR